MKFSASATGLLSNDSGMLSGTPVIHHGWKPFLGRAALGLVLGLTGFIWCMLFVVRMQSPLPIVEPPPNLLPGNPLPKGIPCGSAFARRFECRVNLDDEMVYLTTANPSHTILQINITAHNQTVGNLIAQWGTPNRVARTGFAMYVLWSQRWAYTCTCHLEPASRVEFLGYGAAYAGTDLVQQLPWRGFTDDPKYTCAGKAPGS
jgi:hypothetical protein